MSLTGQPSSSRRKEKAPAERLTPLQEKESENASLRRQVRDSQLESDEVRTENADLKADQEAKKEVIERLSNDLSRRKLEVDSYKEHIAQLQGLLEDLFQERYEELRASNDRYRSDIADARKVMGKQSGPVTLAASKKAETKERANPQFKQSGLHRHAEELEPQKTSKDTTEGGFKTVEVKKDKLADGSSSKAPVLARSLSNTNYFGLLDQDDPWKKIKLPRTAEVPKQDPAAKRYVAPAPEIKFATLTGTSGCGSGVFHGFKTLHSKEHSPVMQGGSAPQAPKLPPSPRNSPQPSDVRSSATPHEAESVKDYAQVAAEPSVPVLVEEGWTDSPGLSEVRRRWLESFGLIPRKNAVKEDTEREQKLAEPSKSSEQLTLGVDGSSIFRSIPTREATLGNRVLPSTDKDAVSGHNARWSDDLEEDGGVEATSESKQPDVESTKAKRSFSQSFSEPELSQKKTKIDRQ